MNAGVAKGYVEGRLRLSVVGDPLRRVNTGNNTPAVIHLRMVLKVTVAVITAIANVLGGDAENK